MKHAIEIAKFGNKVSLPVRERGLKPANGRITSALQLSLPVRERGLKLTLTVRNCDVAKSLPVRERGLKPCACDLWPGSIGVAPRAGAWIEAS